MSRPKSDFKHQNDNLICLFFFNIGMSGGGNSRQGRIVGGWELKPHSMPWQAAIANIGNVQYCGGTIICPRYVMSAAHCSWNDQTRAFVDESDFVVLIGAHEKPPAGSYAVHKVQAIHRPGFIYVQFLRGFQGYLRCLEMCF